MNLEGCLVRYGCFFQRADIISEICGHRHDLFNLDTVYKEYKQRNMFAQLLISATNILNTLDIDECLDYLLRTNVLSLYSGVVNIGKGNVYNFYSTLNFCLSKDASSITIFDSAALKEKVVPNNMVLDVETWNLERYEHISLDDITNYYSMQNSSGDISNLVGHLVMLHYKKKPFKIYTKNGK